MNRQEKYNAIKADICENGGFGVTWLALPFGEGIYHVDLTSMAVQRLASADPDFSKWAMGITQKFYADGDLGDCWPYREDLDLSRRNRDQGGMYWSVWHVPGIDSSNRDTLNDSLEISSDPFGMTTMYFAFER